MEAIRAGRIEIDVLKAGDTQWLTADIQHIDISQSGEIEAVRMRDGKIYRRIDKVVTETVSVSDPVTGEAFNISVAGVGLAIKELMIRWMIEDNQPSHFDPNIGLVILDD